MFSAAVALIAVWLLRRRPWTARLAATLVILFAGTVGVATAAMAAQLILRHHHLSEIPLKIAFLVVALSTAGELYTVLSAAAPLTLPLGLPAVAVFAVLIARPPRVEESGRSAMPSRQERSSG